MLLKWKQSVRAAALKAVAMKITIYLDVTPYGLFYYEDGGSMFLQTVSELLPD
jgi:hypothetical protein